MPKKDTPWTGNEELPIWIGCIGGVYTEIWGHYPMTSQVH